MGSKLSPIRIRSISQRFLPGVDLRTCYIIFASAGTAGTSNRRGLLTPDVDMNDVTTFLPTLFYTQIVESMNLRKKMANEVTHFRVFLAFGHLLSSADLHHDLPKSRQYWIPRWRAPRVWQTDGRS